MVLKRADGLYTRLGLSEDMVYGPFHLVLKARHYQRPVGQGLAKRQVEPLVLAPCRSSGASGRPKLPFTLTSELAWV